MNWLLWRLVGIRIGCYNTKCGDELVVMALGGEMNWLLWH
jgi:hypothetical protein